MRTLQEGNEFLMSFKYLKQSIIIAENLKCLIEGLEEPRPLEDHKTIHTKKRYMKG